MTFYNRNGKLYIRLTGKRVSTKLEDTPSNRKLVTSYHKNDEFFYKFGIDRKKIPTVVNLCEEVLEQKSKTLKKTSMRAYYSMFYNPINDYFKNKLVVDIKPIDIKYFYDLFEDKSSLNTCCAVLRPAFELAILQEIIEHTPMCISKPKIQSEYESNPFHMDELKLILNTAKGQFLNILGVLFFTGLRIGELIALKWSDIDFINKTINIDKTMNLGTLQAPKTKSSKAVIDLPFEAERYFLNQRKITGLKSNVFYAARGDVYKGYTVLYLEFSALLEKLNLKHRGLHQTRHTFASLKLSYGERLEWVSFMLRHENLAFTQKVYYKYIPRRKENRVVFDFNSDTQTTQSIS